MVTGPTAYLVSIPGSNAHWLHNIRAKPRVTLQLERERLEGAARELTEMQELKDAQAAYVGTVNFADYVVREQSGRYSSTSPRHTPRW